MLLMVTVNTSPTARLSCSVAPQHDPTQLLLSLKPTAEQTDLAAQAVTLPRSPIKQISMPHRDMLVLPALAAQAQTCSQAPSMVSSRCVQCVRLIARHLVASPMRQMWMSPLIFMLSLCRRVTPPTMTSSRAFFTSSCPKISGAMLDARRP